MIDKGTDSDGFPERNFMLKTRLIKKHRTIHDKDIKGHKFSQDQNMYLLIPQKDTHHYSAFIMEHEEMVNWRPEDLEFVAIFGHPINKPLRISLHAPDELSPYDFYFFVMTDDYDHILKNLVNKYLEIDIRPDSEEIEDEEFGNI